MESIEHDLGLLERQCREAVDALLARHAWQLLERDEYVRRTLYYFRAGVAADPLRAATYTYSHALYSACSGSEGHDRQNLAYTELSQYLYDCAYHRCPDVCEDATQRALETIYGSFMRCREPGAFLAFAFQHLLDATKVLRRQQNQRLLSLATPIGAGGDTLGSMLPDHLLPNPVAEVLDKELRTRLEECAAEFLRRHPRASQQFDALWLKYIDGLDDAGISQKLGKPISRVHELRYLAVKKLQSDPEWRALAHEWGILTTER
ncbi:MAG: sigma-70 family RNA polymerase sigma factor [Chloroflexota bacterium]|nr:sigma-70 family RNA polymerase sigma factor [Chloroflexota bacterium]